MTSSVIEVRGASKSFGEVRAVDGVDLAIGRGEIFGLIGHNGAGKSTLFKLMLGLLAPSSGTVQVEGVPVDGPRFRDVRRRIGYLPESVVLWDNLTGLETLRFFARLKGVEAGECLPALERVGLHEAARRRVRGYSKGMRQRLGFAQALLGAPAILFLDEPTGGLDPESRREFYRVLREMRGRDATIVLTSHVLAEMQEHVDRIAIMRNGRIDALGTVAALREGLDLQIRVDLRPREGAAPVLSSALAAAGFAPLPQHNGALHVVCSGREKMALLGALGPLLTDLVDVQLREPSLEDIFVGRSPS